MPPLLWAIPIVALMGVGHLPTIIVIGLITFPLVAVTIGEGMSTLPRVYGEMLAVFAPGFRPRLRELVFPHLRPFLGASLKAGLVLAVKASVTAEYFGANTASASRSSPRTCPCGSGASSRGRWSSSWSSSHSPTCSPRPGVSGASLAGSAREPRPGSAPDVDDMRELPRAASHRGRARPASRFDGVSFSWRGREKLLAGVSLTVPPKEIAVISGRLGNREDAPC